MQKIYKMKVGVFGSGYHVDKLPLIRRLFDKLSALGTEIYVSDDFYAFLTEWRGVCPMSAQKLGAQPYDLDIALSVGGDGTFLRTAEQINKQNIPILGINTGRLGFLADIAPDQIEVTLEELYRKHYNVEERMLLQLRTDGHPFCGYDCALNEVAVLKRETSSMITIHTGLNGEYLTSYQADGLVIATPTGSTAYSMSVNGPIILPQSDNIVLSPVAPHSLNVRPLVIPGSYEISLKVESRNDSYLVALDGRSQSLPTDTTLSICKADFAIRVVNRHSQIFYQTLREKLMWGADKRVK